MKKRIRNATLIVGFGLMLFTAPVTALAQDEPTPVVEPVEEPTEEIILPEWFNNLAIAGLALAPVTVAVVQVIKVIGARLGLPDGTGGYIALGVSVVMVALALSAGALQIEEGVAEGLGTVQRVAEAMLTLLAAIGWYSVGKQAEIIRPIARG